MNFGYLVQATNEIFRILLQTNEPTNRSLAKAIRLGCNTLKRLANDREFFTDLEAVSKYKTENLETFEDAVTDIDHFVGGFLEIEKTMLIKAGISLDAANALIDQAKQLREHIKNWNADYRKVQTDVNKLRNEACNSAEALENVVARQTEKEKLRSLLLKIGYGLGGAAAIGVNVSSVAIDSGLSNVGAALSGALGSALIGKV